MADDAEIVRTLKLRKPIHDAGQEVLELQFREPDGELLEVLDRAKGNGEATLAAMAHLVRIGRPALRRLGWRDLKAAAAILDEILNGEDDEGSAPGER